MATTHRFHGLFIQNWNFNLFGVHHGFLNLILSKMLQPRAQPRDVGQVHLHITVASQGGEEEEGEGDEEEEEERRRQSNLRCGIVRCRTVTATNALTAAIPLRRVSHIQWWGLHDEG